METNEPRQVTAVIVPQRRFFINGFAWNLYDETDKVMWNGYRGVHGWVFTDRQAFHILKFWIKLRYFRSLRS